MKKIMLFGSSIFEGWYNYDKPFRGYNVVNRAIGGTQTIHWLEGDLLPMLKEENPDIILMYCGSNDMWELDEKVTKSNIVAIRKIIRDFDKDIQFCYFSIIKSISKREIWNKVERVNGFIEKNLDKDDLFYDFNSIFFENGEILEELFVEDGTHHPNTLYDKLVLDVEPKISDWLKNRTKSC